MIWPDYNHYSNDVQDGVINGLHAVGSALSEIEELGHVTLIHHFGLGENKTVDVLIEKK